MKNKPTPPPKDVVAFARVRLTEMQFHYGTLCALDMEYNAVQNQKEFVEQRTKLAERIKQYKTFLNEHNDDMLPITAVA